MADALTKRSIALTFDLENLGDRTLEAAGEFWQKTLGSEAFYAELKKKIEAAVIADFKRQNLTVTEYNADRSEAMAQQIKSIASDHALNASEKALRNLALRNDGEAFQEKLDQIEDYFRNSKAGIWLDENRRAACAIVNVLVIGGVYAAYTFRGTKGVRKAISLADVDHTIDLGTLRIKAGVANIDTAERTGKLNAEAHARFESILVNGRANGVYDYGRQRFMQSDIEGGVTVPIGENWRIEGGISYSDRRDFATPGNRPSSHRYLKIQFKKEHNDFDIKCELIAQQADSSVNCRAKVRF